MNIAKSLFLLCASLFFAGSAPAQTYNEPNTVVCDTCALATPTPDGTASDTSTTLGVLSHLSGGIDYPPSGSLNPYSRKIYLCRVGNPLEDSRCAIYKKQDYRVDPWSGRNALLSFQFCGFVFTQYGEWLEDCQTLWGLPPDHDGGPVPPSFGPCDRDPRTGVYICRGVA